MTNIFEKSINLGLGIFVYSREKIEDLVEELVSKGEVAHKDARKFTQELIKRGEEQREELKKLIKDEVEEALNHVNVVREEDIVTKDEITQIVREEIMQVLQEKGITKNDNTK